MRATIIWAYDESNRGSAALTASAIELIHRMDAGAEIGILPIRQQPGALDFREADAHPTVRILPDLLRHADSVDATLLGRAWWSIERRRFGRHLSDETVSWIRSSDIVVGRGGVTLHHNGSSVGGTLSLVNRVLPLQLASTLRRPTVLFGTHCESFTRRIPTSIARRALSGVRLCIVRGTNSQRNFQALSPHVPLLQAPDSVFLLRSDSDPRPDQVGGRLIIVAGFGKRAAVRAADFQDFTRVTQTLVDSGRFRTISVRSQVPDDDPNAERLAEALGDNSFDVTLSGPRLDTIIADYENAELVLSARVHGAVLALVAGSVAAVPSSVAGIRAEIFAEVDLPNTVFSAMSTSPGAVPGATDCIRATRTRTAARTSRPGTVQ